MRRPYMSVVTLDDYGKYDSMLKSQGIIVIHLERDYGHTLKIRHKERLLTFRNSKTSV
jgi:hypothetical protein